MNKFNQLIQYYDNLVEDMYYQFLKSFIQTSEEVFKSSNFIEKIGFSFTNDYNHSHHAPGYNKNFSVFIQVSEGYLRDVISMSIGQLEANNGKMLLSLHAENNQGSYVTSNILSSCNMNEELKKPLADLINFRHFCKHNMFAAFFKWFEEKGMLEYSEYKQVMTKNNLENDIKKIMGEKFAIQYEKDLLEEQIHPISTKNTHLKI